MYLYENVPIPFLCPISCDLCRDYVISEHISSMTTSIATIDQPSSTQVSVECKDTDSNCPSWSNLGLCDWIMANNPLKCQKSCKKCWWFWF